MFHRYLTTSIPDFLPDEMSIDEIKLYLIDQRQRQDKDLHPVMLWRLGGPHLDNEMGRWDNVRGKSQENIPTHTILPFANAYGLWVRLLALKAHGSIMFPDLLYLPEFQGLAPSTIKLGRFIENLDDPSGTYYDSEMSSYYEDAVGYLGVTWASIEFRDPRLSDSGEKDRSRDVWRFLTTDGINIYRSMWSLMDVDPVFPGSFEKQLLMEWISHRKVVFLITAYQTYVNTEIMDASYEKQKMQSERYLYPGSRLFTNIETQQALPLSDVEKKGKSTYHFVLVSNL